MRFNNRDGPRSEARDAQELGNDNRENAYQALVWTLINRGRPDPDDPKVPSYPLTEIAKIVAVRAHIGRTTAYLYLEEARCEDPSSPSLGKPDPFPAPTVPKDKALLIYFNPRPPRLQEMG